MADSESFAALFEASTKGDLPQHRHVRVGDVVEGLVVHVGADTVFVELDGKRQAMMDTAQLKDDDGNVTVKVGDPLRAKVVSVDGKSGEVQLGRSFGKGADMSQLAEAREAGIAVEGKVTGANKGGLEVDLGKGIRGFCPLSQMAARPGAEAASFVGQTLSFLVTEIKDAGGVVLSRRRLLEAEAREARERVLSTLERGQAVSGTVTAVRDFGAFVDLGGVEGLIPASELAHERGVAPADRLSPGDNVSALVLEIKDDEKNKSGKRITLSLKALVAPPERKAAAPGKALAIGSVVKGRVVRIEAYGVFVQVDGTDGREGRGLVPAAELDVPRGADLRKAVPEGKELTVKVLETGEGKLKLSVRRAKDDAERADFEAHRGQSGQRGLGTFADLLKGKSAPKK